VVGSLREVVGEGEALLCAAVVVEEVVDEVAVAEVAAAAEEEAVDVVVDVAVQGVEEVSGALSKLFANQLAHHHHLPIHPSNSNPRVSAGTVALPSSAAAK